MTVEIREPTLHDADVLGRMHHAAWLEAYGDLLPAAFWATFLPENKIALWRRLLADPRSGDHTAIAVDDDRIVGMAHRGAATDGEGGAYPAARADELYSIYVLRSHHGDGTAQRLLHAALPPGTPAQLWVFEQNPRARRFYERNGFVADGVRHVFGPELGHQPEIRLVR